MIFHAALDEENLVGPIAVLALDRSGVILTSVLEFRFAFVPFPRLLRRGAPIVLGVRVQRLDKLLLDARLVLAVIVSDVEPVWKSTSGLGDASMAWGA